MAVLDPSEHPDTEIYTVSDWKGYANYECRKCPFATLNLEYMLRHAGEGHRPPAAVSTSTQTGPIVKKEPEPLGKILLDLPDPEPDQTSGGKSTAENPPTRSG